MYRVLALVGLSLVASTPAFAHSWYDPDCCDDRDCAVYIHEIEALPKGDYRLANGQVIPAAKVKRSQDDKFHLCRWDGVINCFYVPDAAKGRGQAAWGSPENSSGPARAWAGPAAPAGGPGGVTGPILRRKY